MRFNVKVRALVDVDVVEVKVKVVKGKGKISCTSMYVVIKVTVRVEQGFFNRDFLKHMHACAINLITRLRYTTK